MDEFYIDISFLILCSILAIIYLICLIIDICCTKNDDDTVITIDID